MVKRTSPAIEARTTSITMAAAKLLGRARRRKRSTAGERITAKKIASATGIMRSRARCSAAPVAMIATITTALAGRADLGPAGSWPITVQSLGHLLGFDLQLVLHVFH